MFECFENGKIEVIDMYQDADVGLYNNYSILYSLVDSYGRKMKIFTRLIGGWML